VAIYELGPSVGIGGFSGEAVEEFYQIRVGIIKYLL